MIVFALQYPGKKGKNIEDFPEVPTYLRVMIWFGLEEDQMDWTKRDDVEGDFSVFAETVSLEAFNENLFKSFSRTFLFFQFLVREPNLCVGFVDVKGLPTSHFFQRQGRRK